MLQRILGSVKILGLCATFGVAGAAQAAVLEHTQDAPYRTATNVAVEKVSAEPGVIVSTPPATEHGGFDLKPQAEAAPAPVAKPAAPKAKPAVASAGQDNLLNELQTLDINQMDANQAAAVQKATPVMQTMAVQPAVMAEYAVDAVDEDATSLAYNEQEAFVEPVGAISPIMFTQQGGVILPFDR